MRGLATSSMAAPERRFSVGLTGGIGSGKTTVADMFGARGAAVIDTDLFAHALTAPGVSRDVYKPCFLAAEYPLPDPRHYLF